MSIRILSWFLCLLCSTCLTNIPQVLPAEDRPDIIYIMADDMGYSDIGCYGSEIETPVLDGLARNGLKFTQFYNAARCCPTRASLLTGLYPHQAGIGHMMTDDGFDGYRGELNRQCVTIAEVLRAAGYRTYMSGKWHVTRAVNPKSLDEKMNWPMQRGFDRFYGTIHGAGSFYDPNSLTRDNVLISPFADPEYQPDDEYYYTDAIADQASRYICDHQNQNADQPFFMYVSFTAAHWPMHAREDDIAKYRGKYDASYHAIRAARYAKMLQLGVIDAESTEEWSLQKSWMEADYLEWDIRNMEVYAAMIDCMDRGIGRIVDSLRETGRLENTLILYLQDNGGCAESFGRGNQGGPRAEAPTLKPLPPEHLQVDMQPRQTRDGYPVRIGKGVMAGPADTYIAYGKAWATVSNTPFREYKHWTHEGGISSPLIAHWPRRIVRMGELEHTPCHLIDLMATAVDIAQAEYPEKFHDGQSIKPMEGMSLASAFAGEGIQREAIYWEHEGNCAVRRDDFKLVKKDNAKWELYNIARDRSEQHDLATLQPHLVLELSRMWDAYAKRANVMPLTPYRIKEGEFKKSKLMFRLKQGDNLSRYESPYVVGRGIVLEAKVSGTKNGVVAAQGGTADGWAVYWQNDRLCFAVTHGNSRSVVRSSKVQPARGRLVATLTRDGAVVLQWNAREIARGNVGQPLVAQPLDGLQIGYDLNGTVGEYTTAYESPDTIEDVVIRLKN